MGRKILNLKLFYKGKLLNFATYNRDFKNKFNIGSDANLFWQILDNSFPRQHTLISKKGNSFLLHLRRGMDVSVNKGSESLSMDDLKSKRMLKGNDIELKEDTSGKINFSGVWQIEYSFSPPRVHVLSQAERAMVTQYSRRSPQTPEQKFTTVFLILAMLFTIVGLVVFDSTHEYDVAPESIVDVMNKRIEQAQLVQTEIPEPEPIEEKSELEQLAEEQPDISKEKAETVEEAQEAVERAQQVTDAELEAALGFDIASDYEDGGGSLDDVGGEASDIIEFSTATEIVSSGTGGNRRSKADVASQFDVSGSGSSLDDIAGSSAGLDEILSAGDLDAIGGGGKIEKVDLASLGSGAGKIKAKKITSSVQFAKIKAARYKGLKKVSAGNIKLADLSPQDRSALANIGNYVKMFQPQLQNLYRKESRVVDMHGTIEFTLYISESGKVEAVDVELIAGSDFTDDFVKKAQDVIVKWKIPVKSRTVYSFRMKFIKQ